MDAGAVRIDYAAVRAIPRPPRSAPGRGSVYYDRSKRLFYAAVSVPGQRQQRSRGFHHEAEAHAELAYMLLGVGLAASAAVPSAELTLGGYLERWLEARRVLGQLRPTTVSTYGVLIRTHISDDQIGRAPLSAITTAALNDFLVRKLTQPGKRGRPLAPWSVHQLHGILSGAFKAARRESLIPANPMEAVDAPRTSEQSTSSARTTPLTAAEYSAMQRMEGYRLVPLAIFCGATGLRMAEALGLEREDLHMDGPVPYCTVRQQLQYLQAEDASRQPLYWPNGDALMGWALRPPKSRRGHRVVGLPGAAVDAARTMLALVEAEAKAAQDRVRFFETRPGPPRGARPRGDVQPASPTLARAYGSAYCRHTDSYAPVRWLGGRQGSGEPQHGGLVFCSETGTPLSRWNVHHRLKRALRRAGLPAIAFHALRHSNATFLGAVLPTTVLRDHMGHATIAQSAVYASDLELERCAQTISAFETVIQRGAS